MKNMVYTLKILGDETRFKIVLLLLNNRYCVGALSKKLNISESAVSQHLKLLKKVNIVTSEKEGYFTHYKINKKVFDKLSDFFKSLVYDDNPLFLDNINLKESCKGKCNKKNCIIKKRK